MRRTKVGLLAVLVGALVLSGCSLLSPSSREPALDGGGLTESEAMAMSLEEQYRLAGERHQELNERFAELQAEIFEDEWLDGSTTSEVIPSSAYMVSPRMSGTTRDNTYYFDVSRWYFPQQDVVRLVREVRKSWEARGWDVIEETIFPGGDIRIFFTTDDGFRFEVNQHGEDEIKFSGHTPPYWGAQHELTSAAGALRDAENEAGVTWDTADRDAEGYAYRLPGVFRPFPAWDAATVAEDADLDVLP